jgi:hypothetical protein
MGPMGPQGPAGTNGVSGLEPNSDLTQVFSANRGFTVSPIELLCPAGKVPVSGGWELAAGAENVQVVASHPIANGWRLRVKNMFGPSMVNNAQVRIWVTCANAQ